jgi:hypothetical protein
MSIQPTPYRPELNVYQQRSQSSYTKLKENRALPSDLPLAPRTQSPKPQMMSDATPADQSGATTSRFATSTTSSKATNRPENFLNASITTSSLPMRPADATRNDIHPSALKMHLPIGSVVKNRECTKHVGFLCAAPVVACKTRLVT